jgi:hypothetical protein
VHVVHSEGPTIAEVVLNGCTLWQRWLTHFGSQLFFPPMGEHPTCNPKQPNVHLEFQDATLLDFAPTAWL